MPSQVGQIVPALATQLTHVGLILAPEHAALIAGHVPGEVELISPVLPTTGTPGNHLLFIITNLNIK